MTFIANTQSLLKLVIIVKVQLRSLVVSLLVNFSLLFQSILYSIIYLLSHSLSTFLIRKT